MMDRRKFLGWVSLGFLATSLPVAIAACNQTSNNSDSLTSEESLPQPPSNNNTNNNNVDNYIPVGLVTTLDQQGQLLNEEKEIIVIRNPENNNLVALSAKCTHKGCLVNWKKDNNHLLCPCHDAQFSPNGEVLTAPADKPLTLYPVKEENGQILVQI